MSKKRLLAMRDMILSEELVVSEILMRLPAKSIIKFRSVCKSWHSLTSEPSFVEAHTHQVQPSIVIPSYFFSWSAQLFLHHIDLHHHDEKEIKSKNLQIHNVPVNPAGMIFLLFQGSCDGLFCFEEYMGNRSYNVCNPATKEWIIVPMRERFIKSSLYAFYYHLPTGEYRLLDYYYSDTSNAMLPTAGFEVFSLKRRNKSWRPIDNFLYDNPPSSLATRISMGELPGEPQVLAHGSVHWAAKMPYYLWILAFDVESEKFRQMGIPKQQASYPSCSESHHMIKLGESLGLCRVTSIDAEMEIWLLRDYAKEEWIKLHTISMQNIIC